ncbi:hypothetical protein vseg_013140 [Gypsophila vaccaria]
MDSFLLDELHESGDTQYDFRYDSEIFPTYDVEHHETFNSHGSGVRNEHPNIIASDNFAENSTENAEKWADELLALDDFPDDCLKFITEILMEEDLDDQTASLQDYTALLATERSLLDALEESSPASSSEDPSIYDQNIENSYEIREGSRNMASTNSMSCGSPDSFTEVVKGYVDSPASTLLDYNNNSVNEGTTKGRKNSSRDADEEGRRNKQMAAYDEEYVEMEQFDDVLLCNDGEDGCANSGQQEGVKGSKKKKKKTVAKGGSKKKGEDVEQVVDLRGLLTQCAQAVASFDLRNANELLAKIRVHSSQYGDSTQRLAYYFGNGLEARLAGTGWEKYKQELSRRVPSSDILKAYRSYVSAIPFRRTSYYVANDAIAKLAENSTRIHIIDFGIFFGFQWPGLIQKLSEREGGPPVVRITGIDQPQSGFRPARRVEETGRRLAGYCERFNVPFKYQAIAKNWDDVTLEELNLESEEPIVVNCLYMSRKLLDETVDETNPRDTFFKLIRKLNPNLLIHGIVNGIYNGPFFETRFREALFHYSAIFDIFEATISRESEERLLGESHLYGSDALNVIACEGVERIERPETYRQWQGRIQRAGFRKLVLDDQVVNRVNAAVKGHYHKDFVMYVNSDWLLQGWKGRILYAISCWTSA